MPVNAIEIQGTLREDGILVLDEKPNLPPGRVKVVLQADQSPKVEGNDAVSVLQRIHESQAERGYVPPTTEEINAELEEMRDDGDRWRLIEEIQESCRLHREGLLRPKAE